MLHIERRRTIVIGSIIAAALLVGSGVFTSIISNNVYAESEDKKDGTSSSTASKQGNSTSGPKIKSISILANDADVEPDKLGVLPPFSVPFEEAAATVKREFPDSEIISGERQYITIKEKSSNVKRDTKSESSRIYQQPVYLFELTKIEEKAVHNITVIVNATSGQIIPPNELSPPIDWTKYYIEALLPPGKPLPTTSTGLPPVMLDCFWYDIDSIPGSHVQWALVCPLPGGPME